MLKFPSTAMNCIPPSVLKSLGGQAIIDLQLRCSGRSIRPASISYPADTPMHSLLRTPSLDRKRLCIKIYCLIENTKLESTSSRLFERIYVSRPCPCHLERSRLILRSPFYLQACQFKTFYLRSPLKPNSRYLLNLFTAFMRHERLPRIQSLPLDEVSQEEFFSRHCAPTH